MKQYPALEIGRRRRLYDRLAHRYDLQHFLITAGADARGRRTLVSRAVKPGQLVLDAGSGTGSTAILAAERAANREAEPPGRIVLFDLSPAMLAVARRRLRERGLDGLTVCVVGDIEHPPFRDRTFDTVLSTYSACPLSHPGDGALALYRALKPGGCLGMAHSGEPQGRLVGSLARAVEGVVQRCPALSMGCRPVVVLPALLAVGAEVFLDRYLGVPLWPFRVFVVRKPAAPPTPPDEDRR